MNPDLIAQMLASGDKAKVSEAQKTLQSMGYSPGGTDGRLGDKTSAAMKAYRDDVAKAKAEADAKDAAARDAVTKGQELEARKIEAEAAKAKAATDKAIAENDPTARVTKMATEIAPYAAGGGLGTAVAHYGFGKPYAAADAKSGDAASRLAKALQIDPGVREDQLDRMAKSRGVRNAAQFAAPATLLGAGYATRNFLAPMFSDPQMQDIVKNVGTGENAAGMTLGVHQLVDMLRRGNPVDPVDEAQIRSDALRTRMDPAQLERSLRGPRLPQAAEAVPRALTPPAASPALLAPPEPASETVRNADRLKQAAKAAGAPPLPNKGAAADHLLEAINDGNRGAIAKAVGVTNGPNLDGRLKAAIKALAARPGASGIAAATLAAGMSMADTAEAADGSAPSVGNRAADAATAAGVAGGATYGMGRLLNALSPTVKQAFGGAAAGTVPSMIDEMTNYTPEDIAQGQNWVARNIPAARHLGGGFERGYEMAQVPERAPAAPPMEAPSPAPETAPMSDFDGLVQASANDPELAELLRQAVMARLGGEQLGQLPDVPQQPVAAAPVDPMAGMVRNLGAR